MTVQATLDKLVEMKMTAMAENYRFHLEDPNTKTLSFGKRFALLVDIEYASKQNGRRTRLIQNSKMDQPQASIAKSILGAIKILPHDAK